MDSELYHCKAEKAYSSMKEDIAHAMESENTAKISYCPRLIQICFIKGNMQHIILQQKQVCMSGTDPLRKEGPPKLHHVC